MPPLNTTINTTLAIGGRTHPSPFTIGTTGGIVTAYGQPGALYLYPAATVSNFGHVFGTADAIAKSGTAVFLAGTGFFNNAGTVAGGTGINSAATTTNYPGGDGVLIYAGGSMLNAGLITGGAGGLGAHGLIALPGNPGSYGTYGGFNPTGNGPPGGPGGNATSGANGGAGGTGGTGASGIALLSGGAVTNAGAGIVLGGQGGAGAPAVQAARAVRAVRAVPAAPEVRVSMAAAAAMAAKAMPAAMVAMAVTAAMAAMAAPVGRPALAASAFRFTRRAVFLMPEPSSAVPAAHPAKAGRRAQQAWPERQARVVTAVMAARVAQARREPPAATRIINISQAYRPARTAHLVPTATRETLARKGPRARPAPTQRPMAMAGTA